MKVIRYDLIGSFKVAVHPSIKVEELGMRVLSYEGCPIADCVFMEVDKIIEDLPAYIEKSDYKLTKNQNQ